MHTRLTPLVFAAAFAFGGVEICGYQIGCSSQFGSVRLDGGDQQVRVVRAPGIDRVVDNDLVFGSCSFTILPNSLGLAA
jgi:hypothetical protein